MASTMRNQALETKYGEVIVPITGLVNSAIMGLLGKTAWTIGISI